MMTMMTTMKARKPSVHSREPLSFWQHVLRMWYGVVRMSYVVLPIMRYPQAQRCWGRAQGTGRTGLSARWLAG